VRTAGIEPVHQLLDESLAALHGSGRRPRALLIDDDTRWAAGLAAILAEDGFEVETAAGGRPGLERLGSAEYELVVLDLLMPGTDGLAVLGALVPDRHRPAVIVASGTDDPALVTAAFRHGADEFLKKPCTREELLIRIVGAAEKLKLRQRQRETEAERQRMAWFDPVTDLPNRRHLEHELGIRLARAHHPSGNRRRRIPKQAAQV
jgi:PleD family two-component response regulator